MQTYSRDPAKLSGLAATRWFNHRRRTDVHVLTNIGNLIEAGLWMVISLVFSYKAVRSEPALRRVFAILAVAFFIFGVSDLIESRTGAWWRPPWLFVTKAACVLAFVWGFRRYYVLKKNRA